MIMKKILVYEGANDQTLERIAKRVADMKSDDTLIMAYEPVMLNIDDAKVLTNDYVRQFCKEHKIEIMENNNNDSITK